MAIRQSMVVSAALSPSLRAGLLHPATTPPPFGAQIVVLGSMAAGSTCFLLHTERESDMPESVYKVIELIGTSSDSWEKAAANAVEQAAKTLRDLRVAEVVTLDMQLDAKGKVEAYRAKLNVSFKFEGS
jgi:dodecin